MKIIANYALCALAFGLFSLAAAPASAHIVLEYQVAPASSYYKATFKVGHGCGLSPIRQIVVNIPPGVQGPKPMPKPGWSLEIAREKLATPYQDHGRTVTEEVSRITWTARTRDDYLRNEWYDEFNLQAKLPATPGVLYWRVSQICEEGRIDWEQVPAAGQTPKDLKAPAAALEILPAAGGGGEHNH